MTGKILNRMWTIKGNDKGMSQKWQRWDNCKSQVTEIYGKSFQTHENVSFYIKYKKE